MEDPEEHVPPPLDAQESPLHLDEQGRQMAAAAVRTMHLPEIEMIGEIEMK